jgi:hypothetical protein
MKTVNECIGDIGRAGSTKFSTFDLTHGCWQMPLEEQSRQLTAFSIPALRQFMWVVGPMGLLGYPESFQCLFELAMTDLRNIIVFIDYFLVHSKKT